MKKIIIAIDGYSSCGKSTTAKLVARKLDYIFIDTGAMYRAVTWYMLQHQIESTEIEKIHKALQDIHLRFKPTENSDIPLIHLNDICVEEFIRDLKIANQVSEFSAVREIRHAMVSQQQIMGQGGGIVMDGRDIGTIVFPQAELKIFLTADIDIRVSRRLLELTQKGFSQSEAEIKKNLLHRDFVDMNRKEGPLKKAEDAIELDTSYISIDQQVGRVMELANTIIREKLTSDVLNT